jgi:suppressor of fused-like protein
MQESLPEQLFDLDPVNEICQRYYPNQINCLQATTQTQYWLNGPDPLDYINIYINDDLGFSSHFHYISLGLSDLYGDERIHK